MLGGLLFNESLFCVLFGVITGVMLHEFYKMTMGTSYLYLQIEGIIAGIVMFILGNLYAFGGASLSVALGIAVLLLVLIMVSSVFVKDHKNFHKTGFIYAGLMYIAVPLALSNAVVCNGGTYSGLLMVAFFCIIWCSDVGAYCFGMLLGQKSWSKKMCPNISPKKSWAGFWGGLLMAMVGGAILFKTGLFTFPLVHCLALSALMHVFGVMGDLFESLWKRAAGIKDAGNLIPGHGGLMDRFDSALLAIPVGYIYLLLFSLV